MRRAGRAVLFPLLCLFHLALFLLPRSRRVWAFGSYADAFLDNSKYAFLLMPWRAAGIRAAWISGSSETVAEVRSLGLKAYHRWSPAGMIHACLAGTYVVSAYVGDVGYWQSSGSRVVNLWHGIPLKSIEFGIQKGPLKDLYNPGSPVKSWLNRLLKPANYRRPDRLLVPSPSLAGVFGSSFRVPKERMVFGPYPRNEILRWPREAVVAFLERTKGTRHLDLIGEMRSRRKAYIYLPTWRSGSGDTLGDAGVCLEELSRRMEREDAVFMVKVHPNETAAWGGNHSGRVRFLPGTLDVYPLLPFTSALVTDYSSVYFDYLFTGKPIIFFPYDLERYLAADREMLFDYDRVTPGPKVRSFAELLAALAGELPDSWAGAREELRRRMWGGEQGELSDLWEQLVGRAPTPGGARGT